MFMQYQSLLENVVLKVRVSMFTAHLLKVNVFQFLMSTVSKRP